MKTKLFLSAIFLFATALTLTLTADAAIPHLVNFQGKATDKTGAPLNNTYNLTFRIYNSETGGSAKWSETQSNVSISNGIFQVQLGSVTPLNLSFDEPYWISIEINTDGEMSPRTRLASVPYAYKAELLVNDPVVPFYKKGFDIQCVDFNSIKMAPGVMDVAGKMFTTVAYSNPLQIAYLDAPFNRDWIHGQKTNNSTAYVYAYNNNGQIAFKLSDEPPILSDHLGNTSQRPLLYRKYPDADGGIYYRYIGKVKIGSTGVISGATDQGASSQASMFSTFGGNSLNDVVISADTNFSTIDDANTLGAMQVRSLHIDAGKILKIDTKCAIIAVSGDCHIHGKIDADWAMGYGPTDKVGINGQGQSTQAAGNMALGGAGGGGRNDGGCIGYAGGGAGGSGGGLGSNGEATSAQKLAWVNAFGINSSAISEIVFSGGGASGGGNNYFGGGSAGGGLIYIEVAGELIFDGEITADGKFAGRYFGGGGGGVVIIRANTVTTNSGVITVTGGSSDGIFPNGGGGAAGYSRIVEL